MAFSGNKTGFDLLERGSGSTAERSVAGKAVAKPKRRSARGSDVVKQEKQKKKAQRAEQKAIRAEQKVVRAEQKANPESARSAAGTRGASRRASGVNSQAAESKRRVAVPGLSGLRESVASATAVPSDTETQRAFLKYANDNAVVRWFYQLVTGPKRHFFYIPVAILLFLGLYLPLCDFYVANRTVQILREQQAVRDAYNESLGKEIKGYMSEEGIEDTARRDLDMVLPGEERIEVEGLDADGNPIVVHGNASNAAVGTGTDDADSDGADASTDTDGADDQANGTQSSTAAGMSRVGANYHGAQGTDSEDSGKLKGADAADKSKTGSGTQEYDPSKTPTTSAEVEAAERAVFENSPWYWKLLDALFLFDGVNGMAVVSTGE